MKSSVQQETDKQQETDETRLARYRAACEAYLGHLKPAVEAHEHIKPVMASERVRLELVESQRVGKYEMTVNETVDPVLAYGVKKRNLMLDLLRVLNSNLYLTQVKLLYLENVINQPDTIKLLSQRRDSGLITFLKALGVIAAGILLPIVGGCLAYQSFFGSRATHGQKLIADLGIPPRIRASH